MPSFVVPLIVFFVLSAVLNIVQAVRIRHLRELIEPFDADHDGRPGGSRKH